MSILTGGQKIRFAIVWFLLFVALAFLGLLIYALVAPTASQSYDPETGAKVIAHHVDASTGLPLVVASEGLVIRFGFCNDGVTVENSRFMDLYSPYLGFEPSAELPLLTYRLGVVDFYVREPGTNCGEIDSPFQIPGYPQRPATYQFRVESCWEANAIRIDCSGFSTEDFLLVDVLPADAIPIVIPDEG